MTGGLADVGGDSWGETAEWRWGGLRFPWTFSHGGVEGPPEPRGTVDASRSPGLAYGRCRCQPLVLLIEGTSVGHDGTHAYGADGTGLSAMGSGPSK